MVDAKAKSGYEAVYRDILGTEDGKRTLENLRRWFATAWIADYSFEVRKDYESGIAETRTQWDVRIGTLAQSFRHHEYTQFRIDVERVVKNDLVSTRLLRDHFGKDVGTRNCKQMHAVDGLWKRHDGQVVRPFYEAMTERVQDEMADVLEERNKYLVGEMIAKSRTDAFAQRRMTALCEKATEDVREVLLRYRDVPGPVLAEAVNAGLVEGVMLE